jgi:RHS repeat-associated protein
VSVTDRNNVGLTFSRQAVPRLTLRVDHTNGRYIAPIGNDSNPYAAPLGFRDSAGREVRFAYDTSNRLKTVTPPSGTAEATSYTYDSTGRLATVTVPGADAATGATRTVTFSYDTSHRVTAVTEESGATTTFAYTSGQTVVTDKNGHAATYTIDAQGRVTATKDALNRSRSQDWTANSDIQKTTDAIGTNSTTYTYDGSGNRTGAQLPTGAAAAAVYSIGASCSAPNTGTAYQPKCSQDDAGNKKQYQYDAVGNLTKQTNSTTTAAVTEFERTYDSNRTICGGLSGQVCSAKDGNGNVTSYSYNQNGDILTVTPPAPLGQTVFTYDSLGRVQTVKDGNNATTTYQYDVRDRIARTTFNNGQYVNQTYYPNGLAKTQTDSAGGAKTFEYDGEGRITKQTGPQTGVTQTFGYDAVGNVTSYTDSAGTVAYTYDAANQLTKLKEPGGTCPSSSAPAANSGCVTFEYDQNALETKRLLPGGATTVTARDNAGRPTRITAKAGTGVVAVDIGYGYTPTGATGDRFNVQTRTSYAEQGVAAGAVTSYTYDTRNRLTLAQEKNGSTVTASWAYTYDNAGNRTQQVRTGSAGGGGTATYGYNAANQLTSSTPSTGPWAYDGAGNQTRNGLTSVETAYGDRGEALSVSFTPDRSSTTTTTPNDYFGAGNTDRLSSGSTTFTSSALGLMQRSAAATQTYTRTPLGVAVGGKLDANRYYYVQDHLGSTVGIFTSSGVYSGGYSYTPYGEARSTGSAAVVTGNSLRYIGGLLDGVNVYKFGARYYDAAQGRFTQVDPSGQETNPYAYAANNPIGSRDPSGLWTEFDGWTIFYGIVGAAGCTLVGNVFAGITCSLLFSFGPGIADNFASWATDVEYPALVSEFCGYLFSATGGYDVCSYT